jgi:ribosomal protein S17
MEILMGAVVKSYMRKSFLKYEERRKYLAKYEEAVSHI